MILNPISHVSSPYRSAITHGDLLVPRTRAVTYGAYSFAVSEPCVWNDLPPTHRPCVRHPAHSDSFQAH